ncbi:MAG TPA: helix-turn-helix transcriptional regulator [Clostridiales bacterium]|nr:helix-turn-helix transcriptional regulator [Clostridiales bacterium]
MNITEPLNRLTIVTGIPFFTMNISDTQGIDFKILSALAKISPDKDRTKPFYFEDIEGRSFGGYAISGEDFLILGPVSLDPARHKNLKHIPFATLCSALSLGIYICTGKDIPEIVITENENPSLSVEDNKLETYDLDNTEKEKTRHSYEDETRFMNDIRYGHPENIRSRIKTSNMSELQKVGQLARSEFKQMEYMACSVFTRCTIAAMEGGLPMRNAYALSDLARQKLELCTNASQILHLMMNVMIDFAEKVKDNQEEKERISYIEKTKNYIANHLNVDFSLADIADTIGIEKHYLSRRFSETQGIGIQNYTLEKRLAAAANMLKFSDVNISHIANYLRFPSQSYMGKRFKEKYGVTPKQYRKKEQLVGFL